MRAIQRLVLSAMLAAAFAAGFQRVARAEDDFPYTAYAAIEGAEVVSGPGHRYYATGQLPLGAKVEIYREESSGWLAIRPPAGSFSWVDAEFIERDEEDDSLGRVIEPTPAWIGTSAERVREHRQHVELKADEVVRILGEKQIETEDGDEQTWLKISPPAGEFRWIHLRDVGRQKPRPVVREPLVQEEPVIREPVASEPAASEPVAVEPQRIEVPRAAIALRDLPRPEPRDTDRRPLAGVEQAQFRSESAEPVRPISSDGFVPRKRRGSEQLQTVPAPSDQLASRSSPTFTRPRAEAPPLATATPGRSTIRSVPTSSTTSESLVNVSRQLEQLEVDLSVMLAQDKSQWDLAGLRQQVEELVERGSDPVARGQARLLLDKIKQFELTFDADDMGPIAAAASDAVEAVSAPSPADPRYDGQGWLKPVVSRRSEKPPAPFALVDADGKPLVFITPSPGLNLNRYVNKQVGVYGRRGYIESLKSSHVTAERVIDLSRQLR